jgi:hypothetical protein
LTCIEEEEEVVIADSSEIFLGKKNSPKGSCLEANLIAARRKTSRAASSVFVLGDHPMLVRSLCVSLCHSYLFVCFSLLPLLLAFYAVAF